MKHLLVGILTFFSLFNFTVQGDTDFDMSSIDYVDENVTISLNMTSDNLMIIEQEFKYNKDEYELVKVEPNKYMTYTAGEEKTEGKYTTIKMLFDSKYAFKSIEYAQITLKPKKENQTGTVIVDKIHTTDLDYKYESVYGSTFEITTDDKDAKVVKKEHSIQNQISEWVTENKKTILTVLVSVLVLLIVYSILKNVIINVRQSKNPFKEVKQKKSLFKKEEPKQYFTDQPNQLNSAEQKLEDQQAVEDLKEIEEKEKYDPISDDVFKGKYEVFIILLLVASLFVGKAVLADETQDKKLEQIRNVIVNDKTYVSSLDIDQDKKVTIVDMLYIIGTEDVTNKGYIKFKTEEEENKEEGEYTTTVPTTEMGMQDMWDGVVR